MGRRFSDEEGVAALLETGSSKAAAKILGVTPGAVRKRKQNPEFARKLQAAKDELLGETVAKLRNASKFAVDALEEIARDREANAQSRTSAANSILSHNSKYLEINDLTERLSRLEEQVKNGSND